MMEHTTALTVSDAIALSDVLSAAQQSCKVAWLDDQGEVRYGTARSLVRSEVDFTFTDRGQDVRDTYLWVTTREGFEVALSVRELMSKVPDGAFVAPYDW